MQTQTRVLSRALTGTAPSEFLIFARGENQSSKGTFLFDAKAAAAVMAAYQRQGVDCIVDREHDSLSDAARAARPDAANALAHFNLELRDGALWATNVAWNSLGLADLASKTRRYTSPAFLTDKTGRIVELINVALVSMPAMYGNAPLIAAGKTTRGNPILAFRVPAKVRARVYLLAASRKTTVKALLLSAVGALNPIDGPTVDASEKLRALVEALGLPPDASRAAVLKAIGDLLDTPVSELVPTPTDAGGDPLATAPDSPPPAQLSANVRRYLDKARAQSAEDRRNAELHGITPAEWVQLKRSMTHRLGSPLVEAPERLRGLSPAFLRELKAKGETVDEYLERRRNTVVRKRG